MTASTTSEKTNQDWIQIVQTLGKQFSERAKNHDDNDSFVEDNFKDLKNSKLFSAQIPIELGGGGASYSELCDILRTLAHSCGSTALAFSMHNHLLAALVWRWKNQKAPVEPLLKRIVAEQIVLISSGGSDWLNGSGVAEKVEGGYKFNGRKIFASASPIGDLLMTTAVVQDPVKGPTVIHFPMSFKSPELKILDTWHVMGMRGTGSHDLEIKDFFVPETSVAVQRPQGKWHPAMHVVAKIAIPIIYSVYYGLAETARNIAIQQCIKKRSNIDTQILIGEMENELTSARLAWDAMVNLGSTSTPGDETTNQVMIYRGLLTRSVLQTVNKAMEAVGGVSFYRSLGLERIFRDIQGAKFHPLQEKPQIRHAGRFALGLPSDE